MFFSTLCNWSSLDLISDFARGIIKSLFDNKIYIWECCWWLCVARVVITSQKNIYSEETDKNILLAPPHLEQNISLPFSFPFPVKYCEIIQAGVSKLILKRLHIPLIYQKLIMSMIFLTLFYFLNKQDKVFLAPFVLQSKLRERPQRLEKDLSERYWLRDLESSL